MRYLFLTITVFVVVLSCMQPEEVVIPELEITVSADTVVTVRDTLRINVDAEGTHGNDIAYYWTHDDSRSIDSTSSSEYAVVWEFPDTGTHTLMVFAVTSDRRKSGIDTISVYVKSHPPSAHLIGDTTASIHDTVIFYAIASDSDGTVDYLLFHRGNTTIRYTYTGNSVRITLFPEDTGEQTISLEAVDNDGLTSEPDSLVVHIGLSIPVTALHSDDTLISINDTALFVGNGSDDDGYLTQYEWIVDTRMPERLLGNSDTLRWVWRYPDTGIHIVKVQVIDDDNCRSLIDSISIHVSADIPTVQVKGKRTVIASDSIQFIASADDNDGTVQQYHWTVSTTNGNEEIMTEDSILTFSWDIRDTGERTVSVTVIDDDSLSSLPSVFTLTVVNNFPVFFPITDTIISSNDTLEVRGSINDSVVQDSPLFYWDVDGEGWDDSTTTPTYRVHYRGDSLVFLAIGVKNDDGSLRYTDTVHIVFNRPPVIESVSLQDGDTVWLGENSYPGSIPFECAVSDPDDDQLSMYIVFGNEQNRDTLKCTDTVSLPITAPGVYEWRLHSADTFGHTVLQEGTVTVGREHTVCFAGHSIVTGVGDTTYSGGFRPGVLAGLRDHVGPLERIRPTGPLTTDFMPWNPSDDSCFAISGAFAREMLLLMDHAYPELTADIWVLMLGVNGGFNGIETAATLDMIRRMFDRNPKARVYVLTSQPYYRISSVVSDIYNETLRDSVASFNAGGLAAFIVESGDSILMDSTGIFNPALEYTGDNLRVHPNVEGYRLLTEGILDVMWEREPQAFESNNEE